MSNTIEIKEGDIYFWTYKDSLGSQSALYWCKAQKAISYEDGKLCDIYWGDKREPLNLEKVNLVFKGNINNLTLISKYEVKYYKEKDIVSLRHPNSYEDKIYIPQGTERDKTMMLNFVKSNIENEKVSIRFSNNEIERLIKLIPLIEAGELKDISL